MPFDKALYDRIDVFDDEKKRTLELSHMKLIPPQVGICDPPARYYPLNNEWAKLIIGIVSWLATIAPWRDATDENYIGIQEVEKFMIGCEPCELILSCFQTLVDTPYGDLSEILQQLRDAIDDLGNSDGTPDTPSIYNENEQLLDEGAGCDLDRLFGAFSHMVDYAYFGILDAIQLIEASTNGLELASKVISAIPILGFLPFDEILEMADGFLEDVGQNFIANYTQALRDEYRCELFCAHQGVCTVYFAQLAGYFFEKAALTIVETDLQDFVEFFTQGIFSGEEICHAMFAFYFGIIAFGGTFIGDKPGHVKKVLQAGFNHPDSDWAILCDTCAWTYTVDFTAETDGWVVGSDFVIDEQGVWVDGTGWRTTWKNNGVGGDDSTRAVCITRTMTGPFTITSVDATYDFTNSGHWDGTGTVQRIAFSNDEQKVAQKIASSDTTGTDKHLAQTGEYYFDTDMCRIQFYSGRLWQDADPGGQVTIKALTIKGVGDNPFI